MISFNLNYSLSCISKKFKIFFENKFKHNKNLFKKTKDNTYDIGSYYGANLIGLSFPKCSCIKDRVDFIFKGSTFYPPTIVLYPDRLEENKKKIIKFINDESIVLKKGYSYGGNDVFLIKNFYEIKNIVKNDNYVLQKEVAPLLYNGYKFDFRFYLIYLREDNNYYVYTVKNGFARIAMDKYQKDNYIGFRTNISQMEKNKNKKLKHIIFYKNFLNKLNVQLENKIYDILKKIAEKHISFVINSNNSFFNNKKMPIFQFWLVGADIIIDNFGNPMLLEINGEPGLYSEQTLPNNIMLNNFWNNIFSCWIENRTNSCHESDYFIKLIQKN